MRECNIQCFVTVVCCVFTVWGKPLLRHTVKAAGQPLNGNVQNQGLNGQLGNVGLQQNIPGQNGLEIMRPAGKELNAELAQRAQQQFQNQNLQPNGKFPQQNQVNFVQQQDSNNVHQGFRQPEAQNPVLNNGVPGGFVQQGLPRNVNQGIPHQAFQQQGVQQNIQENQAAPQKFNDHQNVPNNQNMPNMQMGQRAMNFNGDNVPQHFGNQGVPQKVNPAMHKVDQNNIPQGAPQLQPRDKQFKAPSEPAQQPNQQQPMQVAPPNDPDHNKVSTVYIK